MSSQAIYLDEISTALSIKAITLEAFEKEVSDLSFIGFVRWARKLLTMPDHLHMYYMLCSHYLALARIAQAQNDLETAFRMVEIFGNEKEDASAWWDSPEVGFPFLVVVDPDSTAL